MLSARWRVTKAMFSLRGLSKQLRGNDQDLFTELNFMAEKQFFASLTILPPLSCTLPWDE